jgi:diguanylate cyclase (GGDEF)-like protein
MYYEIHTGDFASHAQSPAILELHEAYLRQAHDGDVPEAGQMPVAAFEVHADHLMLLEPLATGGWRYRHYGAGIAAAAGFDMTGKEISHFDGQIGAFFSMVYNQAAAERRPLFTIHRALMARAVHTWERLVMPIRFPGSATGFLVYNRPRLFQLDFLRAMLEELPDGVMAVRAVRNEAGVIGDAVLVSANPAARAILGLAESDLDTLAVRRRFGDCGAGELWDACEAAIAHRARTRRDIICICCNEARHINIDVAPLLDGAVIRLSDVTVTANINIALELERQRLSVELACQVTEAARLRAEAVIDPLTGLINRRGFVAQAERLLAGGDHLMLAIFDVDHFKSINDRYGHAGGDAALRHVARLLASGIQERGGVVARWGGEEFIALLPHAAAQAWIAVELLRIELAMRPAVTEQGRIIMTVSVGIADARAAGGLEEAVSAADGALYLAKAEGRNQSRMAGRPCDTSFRQATA